MDETKRRISKWKSAGVKVDSEKRQSKYFLSLSLSRVRATKSTAKERNSTEKRVSEKKSQRKRMSERKGK